MKRWISLQAELGNFQQRRAIFIFALKMSFVAVIMSLAIILAMLFLLQWFDLLPLPILEAMRFGVLLAWIIGGTVSGAVAVLAGFSIHRLAVSRAEFERLSRTDMLSGLLNRRAFTEALDTAADGASLVIFDLDRFKAINDRFGHASGDAVIVAVSQILSDAFTGDDVIARLGGEEFGAIIYGGDTAARIARIEEIKERIAEHPIVVDGGSVKITMSAGIADITRDRKTETVYAAADKALYLAKTLGRNRVMHERERLSQVWHRCATEHEQEATTDPRELQRYVQRM
ncbi:MULTISPECIES: GGDEF domain-containing protein [unclassified Rhizobium]|uniref:GGDEF domain-containing protein n=1 Tax=unclassified Rhizobium TaxID=2613769 RepID=UPI000DDC9136|nr:MULTISPECIES: GGDEF domain-containing protein [unclassified Rhizobium]MBB3287898.1 diguanylate cyclase (GGDEF)-like protein [Rhizobium sp. BK252]MBB3402498.1 diguanylate cyclase (GGDEF)-like protein [Rhizobium sp. BK289]MBB3415074.1 diguanylate cyclase (GGDEF)-like protein [Rhizobium sp. BK284]MBB3482963.1 diguanylate cyclase (GGDEF)-like protein [Rhizobium sp. BK347]MDK4720588.1 GGDEF domain-containing protein [Rhizobium sp. CNPSo 3968]